MREGNRIRVTAQLIRGATDEHFWSETYDRELRDVLTVESELAQSIAEKVEVTVTGEEHQRLTAARSVAPEVYESYLKGRFAYGNSNSRADIEESIGLFPARDRDGPDVCAGLRRPGSCFRRTRHGFYRSSSRRDARESNQRRPKSAGTGAGPRRSACRPRKRAAGTVALGRRRG